LKKGSAEPLSVLTITRIDNAATIIGIYAATRAILICVHRFTFYG
jgi:hypothetical protein